MTTQEKVEELCKDFLQRKGKNFTHIRRSGRIGWENTISYETSYSDRFLNLSDKINVIQTAYTHAKDMITSMNIPYKVVVKLGDKSSYTDSKEVHIATAMFDDNSLSLGKKFDIFTGLAVHESCHLLYTDFQFMPQCKNRIIASLLNVIEDERIEMLCGEERPGFANFLCSTKEYYFAKEIEPQSGQDDVSRLFNTILGMIRYPSSLKQSEVEYFADTLLEVRDIIMPYPRTCEEAFDAANKIYEIIKNYINKEEQDNKSENDSNQEQSKENGNNTSSRDNKSNNNSNQEQSKEKGYKKLTDKEIEKLLPQLNIIEQLPYIQQEKSKDLNYRIIQIIYGNIVKGMTDNVDVYKVTPCKEKYLEVLSQIKPYIPAVSSILRKKGTLRINDLRGLRSGTLDTGKLAEAIQGKDNIYRQEKIHKADEINVCILIDQSGSMSKDKIQATQQTAILLNEALSSIKGIRLFIYGHSTSGNRIALFTYKEDSNDDKYKLGNIQAYNLNIDSNAIIEVSKRIRNKTQNDCLMFVISDGMPCEDISITQKAISNIQKKGFNIIGIGISAELNDLKKIYKQYIQIDDLQRLAPELGKLTKKQTLKM